MDKLSSRLERPAQTAAIHRQSIERVVLHMRTKLADPLNLDQLAKHACFSKFHFLRVFEEITGTTPHHFLSCLRIERAKELLLDTALPVTDICMDVGYASLGSFSASFTELVGISPRAFRASPGQLTPEQFFTSAQAFADRQRNHPGPFLEGRLDSQYEYRGYYFVGVFTRGVPQGLPHSGIVMLTAGKFRIPAPDTRVFHLLAALLPFSAVSERQHKKLKVSLVASQRIDLGDSTQQQPLILRLRQPQLTDPPIVVFLSALLTTI